MTLNVEDVQIVKAEKKSPVGEIVKAENESPVGEIVKAGNESHVGEIVKESSFGMVIAPAMAGALISDAAIGSMAMLTACMARNVFLGSAFGSAFLLSRNLDLEPPLHTPKQTTAIQDKVTTTRSIYTGSDPKFIIFLGRLCYERTFLDKEAFLAIFMCKFIMASDTEITKRGINELDSGGYCAAYIRDIIATETTLLSHIKIKSEKIPFDVDDMTTLEDMSLKISHFERGVFMFTSGVPNIESDKLHDSIKLFCKNEKDMSAELVNDVNVIGHHVCMNILVEIFMIQENHGHDVFSVMHSEGSNISFFTRLVAQMQQSIHLYRRLMSEDYDVKALYKLFVMFLFPEMVMSPSNIDIWYLVHTKFPPLSKTLTQFYETEKQNFNPTDCNLVRQFLLWAKRYDIDNRVEFGSSALSLMSVFHDAKIDLLGNLGISDSYILQLLGSVGLRQNDNNVNVATTLVFVASTGALRVSYNPILKVLKNIYTPILSSVVSVASKLGSVEKEVGRAVVSYMKDNSFTLGSEFEAVLFSVFGHVQYLTAFFVGKKLADYANVFLDQLADYANAFLDRIRVVAQYAIGIALALVLLFILPYLKILGIPFDRIWRYLCAAWRHIFSRGVQCPGTDGFTCLNEVLDSDKGFCEQQHHEYFRCCGRINRSKNRCEKYFRITNRELGWDKDIQKGTQRWFCEEHRQDAKPKLPETPQKDPYMEFNDFNRYAVEFKWYSEHVVIFELYQKHRQELRILLHHMVSCNCSENQHLDKLKIVMNKLQNFQGTWNGMSCDKNSNMTEKHEALVGILTSVVKLLSEKPDTATDNKQTFDTILQNVKYGIEQNDIIISDYIRQIGILEDKIEHNKSSCSLMKLNRHITRSQPIQQYIDLQKLKLRNIRYQRTLDKQNKKRPRNMTKQ